MTMDDTQLEPDSPAQPETTASFWKTDSDNGIEVSFEPYYWSDESLSQLAQILTKLLDHIDEKFDLGGILVGLLLCGDNRIRELNNQFRGIDKATNVLAFPQLEGDLCGGDAPTMNDQSGRNFFGEIAIACETLKVQAAELGININDHLAHLFVHGVIHLLGYDHENDKEAAEMEALEVAILAKLSIANPYMIAQRAVNHGVMS